MSSLTPPPLESPRLRPPAVSTVTVDKHREHSCTGKVVSPFTKLSEGVPKTHTHTHTLAQGEGGDRKVMCGQPLPFTTAQCFSFRAPGDPLRPIITYHNNPTAWEGMCVCVGGCVSIGALLCVCVSPGV